MPELFGIDIAQNVADAFQQAGGLRPVVIVRETGTTRDPNNLSAGLRKTEARFTAQGFVEQTKFYANRTSVIESANQVATILGATISPATSPQVGDRLEIDGGTYVIVEIRSDPAQASYECACV